MTAPSQLDMEHRHQASGFDWDVHAVFALCGVATTVLGPLVPGLMLHWSLSHAQIGTFFTCQFLGALAGNMVAVVLIPRGHLKRAMAMGALCMAIGILTLGRSSALAGMASVALYGIGNGLAVPAGNLLVARVPIIKRAGALSFLNFIWGLGAVATSPLLALWQDYGDWRWLLAIFAAVLFALAFRLALASRGEVALRSAGLGVMPDSRVIRSAALPPPPAGYWPMIVTFAVGLFLYVAVENTFGGWAATHAKEVGLPRALSTIMPGVFYGSLVAVRGAAPLLFRVVRPRRAAEVGIAVAVAGSTLLVTMREPWAVALAFALLGGGLATVFPTMLAIFSEAAGSRTEKLGPIIFAITNVGASAMLGGVGVLMDKTGSSSQALLLPFFAQVLLLAILLWRIPRLASGCNPAL